MTEIDYKAAEMLANKARNSIGKYCMEECMSMCCRDSSITLTDKEVKLIAGDKILTPNQITLKKDENKLNLKFGCPCFIDNKCAIHKSKARPKICKMFPLFIRGNRVVLAHDCPAIELGKLYPYLHKFKKMGFIIV